VNADKAPIDEMLFEKGYGWQARIGFLSPGIVDESLTRQFYRMAPPGVTMVRTSLSVTDVTPDQIRSAIERAGDAARELAREDPDCIVIGGSPTVVIGGFGSDRDLIAKVEAVSGVQTTAAQTAAVEALHALGATSVALATPFRDSPFADLLADFLEKSGFEVRSVCTLDVPYKRLTQAPLRLGYELAKETYRRAGTADAVYFPGAPFPVADLLEVLEEELQTNVISSMQCTLWKGMQMAGVTGVRVDGYGRLLRL
jgi:maleate isomerase